MSTEEWRDVPGYDGRYQVSNHGRVRSVKVFVLKPIRSRGNYSRVSLMDGRRPFIHALVASAFIGPRPSGYQINHIDSNRTHNTPENLEYVTPLENQQHSWRMTDRRSPHRGETTPFAKLSETDVIRIRTLRQEGLTYKQIAARFDTKPANVWHICSGHTWKHLLPGV